VKYEFILGLKKLLLKFISKTNTNKKETNRKEKKIKQGYARVDLDLNDS